MTCRHARLSAWISPALALLIIGAVLLRAAPAEARFASWTGTLDKVSRAVMALEVSVTRSLDTESATSAVGTGFVVDKELGILLTNRHLVHVGPVRARGITHNNEEVALTPIYRDPVHDFGFYRFNPDDVRYMDLVELKLAPERARVGTEIRVVGNDGGDKLSILDGTIARVDRPAPDYGRGSYNDFNIFYLQAATSTSGGSSGSPVVDRSGAVVALNAGGRRNTASSFYLPVDRASRALDHLRRGEPVPRGTVQAVYGHTAFEELRRLGLTPATEARVRGALRDAHGMLVVQEVIPGGPAQDLLEPGDILVEVEGRLFVDFDTIEEILDSRVGGTVRLAVERGGTPLTLDVLVEDLHSLTPSRFVEFSQGVLHEVSLQMGRNHNVPAAGVMLADPGYAFRRAGVGAGTLILELDDEPIRDLDDLVGVLARIPHRRDVRVRTQSLSRHRRQDVSVLTMDRRWAPTLDCRLDDAAGLWRCEELPEAPQGGVEGGDAAGGVTFQEVRDPVAARLAPSLCHVRYSIPYRTEGVEGWSYVGTGVVVDKERGLVVTDRGTVPVALGDVQLTFAGSIRVPGEVLFVHPVHNMAVVRYDPRALGSLPVEEALLIREADLDAGDKVHQVGLTSALRVVSQETTISRVDMAPVATPSPPSFRQGNAEVYKLADSASSIGGVLADITGGVVALWAFNLGDSSGHFTGLPVSHLLDALDLLRAGEEPVISTLGVEVSALSLSKARDRGMPDDWVARLSAADPERRHVLTVVRAHPMAPAHSLLRGGDVLLALDGVPLTRPRQLEATAARAVVTVTRLRSGEVEDVLVPTHPLDGGGLDEVVSFAGALFHEPHWPVGLQYGVEGEGLYLSWYWYGGPGARHGLRASTLVRKVDGEPVTTLRDFLDAVSPLEDGDAVRLEVESLNGVRSVTTLLTDLVYWPTAVIRRGPDGWRWQRVGAPDHREPAPVTQWPASTDD